MTRRDIGLASVEAARQILKEWPDDFLMRTVDSSMSNAQIVRGLSVVMTSLTTTLVRSVVGGDLKPEGDARLARVVARALQEVQSAMTWLSEEDPNVVIHQAFAERVIQDGNI